MYINLNRIGIAWFRVYDSPGRKLMNRGRGTLKNLMKAYRKLADFFNSVREVKFGHVKSRNKNEKSSKFWTLEKVSTKRLLPFYYYYFFKDIFL